MKAHNADERNYDSPTQHCHFIYDFTHWRNIRYFLLPIFQLEKLMTGARSKISRPILGVFLAQQMFHKVLLFCTQLSVRGGLNPVNFDN